ncbi:MAG TPA: CsbD family protein [Acidimicrobiales bacterium]|jgi:uncharacterized protein YjbJ (UPF0337 family)|nr:CsbD family protein [Acidimicrobiales bacterium]
MVEKSTNAKRTVAKATTHTKNAAEVAKGRVKAAAGKTTGNRRLQAEGKLDEIKGRAKKAGQRVKESLGH